MKDVLSRALSWGEFKASDLRDEGLSSSEVTLAVKALRCCRYVGVCGDDLTYEVEDEDKARELLFALLSNAAPAGPRGVATVENCSLLVEDHEPFIIPKEGYKDWRKIVNDNPDKFVYVPGVGVHKARPNPGYKFAERLIAEAGNKVGFNSFPKQVWELTGVDPAWVRKELARLGYKATGKRRNTWSWYVRGTDTTALDNAMQKHDLETIFERLCVAMRNLNMYDDEMRYWFQDTAEKIGDKY